eukprot:GHVL01038638.1.p1 GENE.GHVL01038638.1~~GHVL01038638.1.p1  ORF type:complete len:466 (-),score=116.97 GHVL01038638.1:116-1513(-)
MTEGGRRGSEKSATALADCLKQFMTLGRLKTGTPPRLSIETINFKKLISQESEKPTCFSFVDNLRILPIKNPYQAYTNERTHDLVLKSVDSLPSSKNALIETKKLIAPRYCPSLLTKIERFPEKESHAIWLEPEGINSNLIYPGGLAGAFSPDIQQKIVQTIYGLEEAIVEAPGYDVEYDFIDSTKLHPTLESKHIRGLYFAGQICGTTGYEEAAALGLIAGLNAGLSVTSDRGFTVSRDNGYIGVLVDDLVTLGVSEPYRMFTCRAENRFKLRQDNADFRLTRLGFEAGFVSKKRFQIFEERYKKFEYSIKKLENTKMKMSDWYYNKTLEASDGGKMKSASDMLGTGEFSLKMVEELSSKFFLNFTISKDVSLSVEGELKYIPYLKKNLQDLKEMTRLNYSEIPHEWQYDETVFDSLSIEEKEVLRRFRPKSVSDVSKLSGITAKGRMLIFKQIIKKKQYPTVS